MFHGNKKTPSESKPSFSMGLDTSDGCEKTLKAQVPGRKDAQQGEHPHLGWAPGLSAGARGTRLPRTGTPTPRAARARSHRLLGSARGGDPLGVSSVISYKTKHTPGPYLPAASLLGTDTRNENVSSKRRAHKCPPTGEWANRRWHIQA